MAASRKAHDTHVRRIDVPLLGLFPYHAQCGACVLDRDVGVSVGHAVTQDEGRDSLCVEPSGHARSFVIEADGGIASARTYDDGLSGRLVGRGGEQQTIRLGGHEYDVLRPAHAFGGQSVAFRRAERIERNRVGRGRLCADGCCRDA